LLRRIVHCVKSNFRYCEEPRLRQAPMRSRPGPGRLRGDALGRRITLASGGWVRPVRGVTRNHL